MFKGSAVSVSPPPLGVGITYSAAVVPLLDRKPELIDVVEIEPQTTWVRVLGTRARYVVNEDVVEEILRLPGHKLIHSIGTPVGGSVRPEPEQLALLGAAVERFKSPWISDHLSFNRTPEFATGFFLPPRQTLEGVQTVTGSIRDLQRALPAPVAVETGVNYLRPRQDELSDGEFLRRVVTEADCGLLLDLHNVFTNALNGRQPLDELLDELPLERVWEIHLAGGMEFDGFWLDAHSGAIPDALYAVVEKLIPKLPNLGAIIFEIFPSFVPEVGLELVEEQLQRLHRLWARRAIGKANIPSATPNSADAIVLCEVSDEQLTPETWERALGALVTGQPLHANALTELSADPGIKIISNLVFEFRASLVVGTLRLTSRLLMLALGPDALRTILLDYTRKIPPQLYGALEADKFGSYLLTLGLQVPHLTKILEFEQATIATLTDDQPRVVRFDFEPLPLLRSLAEGRLASESGVAGAFEIELTADGQANTSGINTTLLKDALPYH